MNLQGKVINSYTTQRKVGFIKSWSTPTAPTLCIIWTCNHS